MSETITPSPIQEPVSVDDNSTTLSVDDGAGSLTVDGTVAATLSEPISIDDNGGSLTVDGTVTVTATDLDVRDLTSVSDSVTAVASGDHTVVGKAADGAAVSGNPVLIAGQDGTNTQSIHTDTSGDLQVDVLTMPTTTVSATDLDIRNLVQATDSVSIGDGTDTVDVLADGADNVGNSTNQLVVAGMNYAFDGTAWDRVTNGGGTEATALRVTVASDSTGVLSVDDNGGTLTVDGTVTANQGTAGTAWEVVGDVASDVAVPANPVTIGGRASTAIPTAVSADGDSVNLWANRNGAPVVTMAPHLGLFGDPWSLVHEAAQYTTAQTSTALVAGGASERIVVTSLQIQAFSTTSGTCIVYFGTGAYARGTNRAIFDGEFAPSATLKPGIVMQGPFISGTNGDDILVTSVGDIDITVSVWYYVVT